ncbi:MAG: hypothetical protein KBA30_06560, partial [Clostridia bacterium]|nr:hypothetical protein [Clostridia bacterium]
MERTLSEAGAQHIVDEVGTLTNRRMLIARPDGRIIAACDRSLVGRSVRTDPDGERPAPAGEDDDPPFRAAAVFPVTISGETACYVGLCGEGGSDEESDDALAATRVLGVMTGVLIESIRERQKEADVRGARDRFLEEWLFSSTLPDDKSLETRGRQLGIDVNRARTAGMLLLDPAITDEAGIDTDYSLVVEGALDLLRKSGVGGRDAPVTAIGNRIVLLIDTDSTSEARERLDAARQAVEGAFPIRAAGGIGMPRKTFAEMRDSTREAERAARNAQSSRRRDILAFGDITLELFLQEVPARVWREFRSRVLRGLSDAEAAEWTRLLAVYFQ